MWRNRSCPRLRANLKSCFVQHSMVFHWYLRGLLKVGDRKFSNRCTWHFDGERPFFEDPCLTEINYGDGQHSKAGPSKWRDQSLASNVVLNLTCLVVTGTWLLFFHIFGMSSSQLTHIFQRGRLNHQPVTFHRYPTHCCIMVFRVRLSGAWQWLNPFLQYFVDCWCDIPCSLLVNIPKSSLFNLFVWWNFPCCQHSSV